MWWGYIYVKILKLYRFSHLCKLLFEVNSYLEVYMLILSLWSEFFI